MDVEELIKRARQRRNRALTEHESKKLLAAYGIPVPKEAVAADENAAVRAADDIGYPVVVKGLGADLLHKTEAGLVCLNLADSSSVAAACGQIRNNAGDALEGFLVQPMLAGRRELLAGLFRDPQFGAVVMVGAGGIFTEVFSDVSMRLAPLSEPDAEEMLDELSAAPLLGSFRGEAPADRARIRQILLGLSRIGVECAEVAEVDINPIIISPAGEPHVADALVVAGEKTAAPPPMPQVAANLLGDFFHPKSIAFVGASGQIGKWGHMLFTLTVSGGFAGDIYLVNQKGGTIAGRPVYKNVGEIAGAVDLAVVTVPAAAVSGLIEEFAAKKIRNMLLVSSGFGETGQEGKRLESRLVESARKAGILIIGPNTMGICNPHIHLYCTGSHVRPQPGATAVVAQSGNMGTQLLAFAEQQGIGIRGFCGSGNEAMVTVEDFLEGFEKDSVTETIMLYVESVKDGRRFFNSACRVGRSKPIILLKGGRSSAGHEAAASHTGAMASDVRVFDAVCRQAGIVQVEHPMDLLDLSAAFSSVPIPEGNRVAIMTLGGGWGVVTADLCAQYGLAVPQLAESIVSRLDGILPAYWSRANPVDIVGEKDDTIPMVAIEELLRWDGCDAVINLGIVGRRILLRRLVDSVSEADPSYSEEALASARQMFDAFERKYIAHIADLMERYQKPVYGVSLLTEAQDRTVTPVENKRYKGLFYPTPERAVKAVSKMVEYGKFLARQHHCGTP
ncbi:MAG: acetate--CoA ligase family protein [Desulfobacterales bacterium]|nr:acetate--CoA ligase family protein [Desulfobacterales bacterium]